MPRNTITYELLISCPGDIQSEIDIIKGCINEFNDRFSEHLGITVLPKHWSTSAFTQSGNKPQELLNDQFVKSCDAAVSVFWTRFGTPTENYGSGTEEEIEIMIDAGKQVFMYFSEKGVNPHEFNQEQFERIKLFKHKYKEKGIYYTYNSEQQFKELFFSHLTMFFLSKKKIDEYTKSNLPNLVLRGISENNSIENSAKVRKLFDKYASYKEEELNGIEQLYTLIGEIEVENSSTNMSNGFNFTKKVEIIQSKRDFIRVVAKELSIELDEKFFDLGGLSENTIESLSTFGKRSLIGGTREKQKYNFINELFEKIYELSKWIPIQEAFGSIDCLFFALENNGKSFDEDIDITLEFDNDEILTDSDRPKLSNSDLEYLIKDCDLTELLKIDQSSDYLSYDESVKVIPKMSTDCLYKDPFGYHDLDYQEEYSKVFSDALSYEIFKKENSVILKTHFDYIKHNSIVAFPSPVLLKKIPKIVKYKIRSKHISDVVYGTINVTKYEE